ncbi:MAG: tRNA (adenosine(37)-N6)-threonylcarbamoyltransferase complex dimerization subunit type 1 TsaB [Nitrospira sp.]|nr:tRNA (adenosine(37)-N6)-threonylcarbamoyltransferase complex dimerization subunit type 1 TsaB [Nitrospira sp.]
MKLLAVETATQQQSVAILEGATLLGRSDEAAQGNHAMKLIPMIDRLLQSTGLRLADLDGLAVSIGPGSFTGLRVGLATVMGIRSVTGLPLAAVPTLDAMAWNVRQADRLLCPVLKARTREVYWGFYRWAAGTLVQVAEERVGSIEAFAQSIEGPTVMLGDGWLNYGQDVQRLLGDRAGDAIEASREAMAASAVSVGLAGLERLARGEVAGRGLAPRYVQRAEAEIAWQRRVAAAQSVGGERP